MPDEASLSNPWKPGPIVPQTRSVLRLRFGYGVMRLFGWDFSGAFPDRRRFVAMGAEVRNVRPALSHAV